MKNLLAAVMLLCVCASTAFAQAKPSKGNDRVEDLFGVPYTGKVELGIGGLYESFHGTTRLDHFGFHASVAWMPPSLDGKKPSKTKEPDRFGHFVFGLDYIGLPQVLTQPVDQEYKHYWFSEVSGRADFFFVKSTAGFVFLGAQGFAAMHLPGAINGGVDDYAVGGHAGAGFAAACFSLQGEGGFAYHPSLAGVSGDQWFVRATLGLHITRPNIDLRFSYERSRLALKDSESGKYVEIDNRNTLSVEVFFHFNQTVGLQMSGQMDVGSYAFDEPLRFWYGEIALKFAF